MALIIQKFGGTSVASVEVIQKTAHRVLKARQQGHEVVVVVSAMAGVTSQLIEYVRQISLIPDPREYDVVASTGEQITCGLMALALKKLGVPSRSWLAWQVPILSQGHFMKSSIKDIPTQALRKYLKEGGVPVVAGFQAITEDHHLTTLGRGGSDLTAVALAAALKADECQLYKDVDGVYTADPQVVSKARKIDTISYEEMLEFSFQGAKVLQSCAVEAAIQHKVPLRILPTFEEGEGTTIFEKTGLSDSKTNEIKGLACTREEARITLHEMPSKSFDEATFLQYLKASNISVGMILRSHPAYPLEDHSLTFTVPRIEMEQALALIKNRQKFLGFQKMTFKDRLAKISLIGHMPSLQDEMLRNVLEVLTQRRVSLEGLALSPVNLSLLIEEEYTELVLRALHTAFGLDKDLQNDARAQIA